MDESRDALLDAVHAALRRLVLSAPNWLQSELTPRQLQCLVIVASQETTPMLSLRAEMGMSRALTSNVVDRLVRRGLVTRIKDDRDRRRATLRLTPLGDAMIKRLYPGFWVALDTYLAELETAELLALHRALRAIDTAR